MRLTHSWPLLNIWHLILRFRCQFKWKFFILLFSSFCFSMTSRKRSYSKHQRSRKNHPRRNLTDDDTSRGEKSFASRSDMRPVPKKIKKVSPTMWENIVLHYLSKLKNVLPGYRNVNHPIPGKRPDASIAFHEQNKDLRRKRVEKGLVKPALPQPQKYFSTKLDLNEKGIAFNKEKAFNIVSDALQYGVANGVVKKSGKYFYISFSPTEKKKQTERCNSCEHCNLLNEQDTNSVEGLGKEFFAHNRSRNIKRSKILPTRGYPVKKNFADNLGCTRYKSRHNANYKLPNYFPE